MLQVLQFIRFDRKSESPVCTGLSDILKQTTIHLNYHIFINYGLNIHLLHFYLPVRGIAIYKFKTPLLASGNVYVVPRNVFSFPTLVNP
jgi:hypothetical protein